MLRGVLEADTNNIREFFAIDIRTRGRFNRTPFKLTPSQLDKLEKTMAVIRLSSQE